VAASSFLRWFIERVGSDGAEIFEPLPPASGGRDVWFRPAPLQANNRRGASSGPIGKGNDNSFGDGENQVSF
jgi:hypothetical protein